MFFLQSGAGARRWPVTEEIRAELGVAMAAAVGSAASVGDLEKRYRGGKDKFGGRGGRGEGGRGGGRGRGEGGRGGGGAKGGTGEAGGGDAAAGAGASGAAVEGGGGAPPKLEKKRGGRGTNAYALGLAAGADAGNPERKQDTAGTGTEGKAGRTEDKEKRKRKRKKVEVAA